jgi:hypothetical protein
MVTVESSAIASGNHATIDSDLQLAIETDEQ